MKMMRRRAAVCLSTTAAVHQVGRRRFGSRRMVPPRGATKGAVKAAQSRRAPESELLRLFVSCSPGLEPLLERELAALGYAAPRATPVDGPGGFEVEACTLRDVMKLNLQLRTATRVRVLVRLASFKADNFSTLKHKLRRHSRLIAALIPGGAPGADPPVVKATASKSKLYHTVAIEQRVREVLEESASRRAKSVLRRGGGKLSSGTHPPPQVLARVRNDVFVASVDSSGDPLSDRAYRVAATKAPLKSTLAAALVMAASDSTDFAANASANANAKEEEEDLIVEDPFCGGGTVPIEAALLRTRSPPGAGRSFAFEAFPSFDEREWDAVCREAAKEAAAARRLVLSRGRARRQDDDSTTPPYKVLARGSDRDAGAVAAARQNAEKAGVADLVRFECAAFTTALDRRDDDDDDDAPETGADDDVTRASERRKRRRRALVTNPPHFKRLQPNSGGNNSNDDPRDLFSSLGRHLRRHRPGARVGLFLGQPKKRPFPSAQLLAHLGFDLHRTARVVNSGVSSVIYTGVVPTAGDATPGVRGEVRQSTRSDSSAVHRIQECD